LDDENKLGKDDIVKYYEIVKNKIQKYINELDEEILDEKIIFNEMSLTKMELILAQLRHIFYHIGYLHCNIKMEKGETPEYIRVVRKLQFLNNLLIKSHFCRALARKNARLVREPTGFPHKSIVLYKVVP